MNLYVVIASVDINGSYREYVSLMKDMEEKPKTYVGYGRKIKKELIGQVDEGAFYGSFKMHLLDESDIPYARKVLKDRVRDYHYSIWLKHDQALDAIGKHSLDDEIEIKARES